MNVTRLAWRNLWRRKRRTLITAFSIGFGVMLAVTFTGTGDYGYTNMINAGADMGLGHVTVEPLGYNQTPALSRRLFNANRVREDVSGLPGVDTAMTRISGQAMFATARKSVGGMFLAIDPAGESETHNLFIRSIAEGDLFSGSMGRGVVIGTQMAKKLGLSLGKKMIYTTTDVNGEMVSEITRVSAIFKTGINEIDGAMVLLPIDSVRFTLNYGADDASYVAVVLDDYRRTSQVRAAVQARVGNRQREVLSWKETQPDLAGIIAMDRGGNYISQILVGLLIAAGILNTLLMSVMERTKEFGVMMAIGMPPRTLFKLVIVESIWMALLGLVIGIVISTPWYLYLYNVGIDFSSAIGDDYSAGGVLIDPVMRIRLYRESIAGILAGLFSLTLISGLYPAWRATRVSPVESLKTV